MHSDLLKPFVHFEMRNWRAPRGVPLLRSSDGQLQMLVLHTFSGHRREGDWHDWMHRLFSQYFPGVELVCWALTQQSMLRAAAFFPLPAWGLSLLWHDLEP